MTVQINTISGLSLTVFIILSYLDTTRDPRPGEENGKHYHFIEVDIMKEKIQDGEFIEHAQFSDNYYGTR